MLPTFVIGLREGVEAALIVGIVAAFLRQENRTDALRWVWAGVLAAVAICVAVGVALELLDATLPQREQEGLETVVAFVAVGVVSFMIVWMRRHARGMAGELRASARAALAEGSVGALVGMAFFAVIREGFETVVFLLAAFQSATNPTTAGLGAVLGVVVAVVIGAGIYRGGVRLNLTRFFRATGFVLVLVAAGLVASALHTAHEAGWLNAGQGEAVDLSWLVVPGTWTASLLTGMLGLQPHPTVVELVGYLVYAVPMAIFVLWPHGRRPRAVRQEAARAAATAAFVALAALAFAACGSDTKADTTKAIEVRLTDKGCEPARLQVQAGKIKFAVTNEGTSKVSEFEILDGSKIIGEKENLASGLSGDFTVDLKPGRYTTACPGGSPDGKGVLEVSAG
jgi:high-affinity iron transporter